jgi:hypothetical protein
LKTGNRIDGCVGKRDSQLKPVAAFDLICVIYILPDFFGLRHLRVILEAPHGSAERKPKSHF